MQSQDTRERLAALQGLADAGVNHSSRGGQWEKSDVDDASRLNIYLERDITAALGSHSSTEVKEYILIFIRNLSSCVRHRLSLAASTSFFLPNWILVLYLTQHRLPGLIAS